MQPKLGIPTEQETCYFFIFTEQDLDTEIIVATARGPNAAAISANVVIDERQMNALFLDVVGGEIPSHLVIFFFAIFGTTCCVHDAPNALRR